MPQRNLRANRDKAAITMPSFGPHRAAEVDAYLAAEGNARIRFSTLIEGETNPYWAPWWDHINTLIHDHAPANRQGEYAAALRREGDYLPRLMELATGRALRLAGVRCELDRPLPRAGSTSATPDWTGLDTNGAPVIVVDTKTIMPIGEFDRQHRWAMVAEAVRQTIPYPVAFVVRVRDAVPPPADEDEAAELAAALHLQLRLHPRQHEFQAGGSTFYLFDSAYEQQPRLDWSGILTGRFLLPRPCYGLVDETRIAAAVQEKVTDYAPHLGDVPLVVALTCHPWVGLSAGSLHSLVAGGPRVLFNQDVSDQLCPEPLPAPETHAPPWTPPPELAAVVWIDNVPPFDGTWWHNPAARNPLAEHVSTPHGQG
ncbi:hypothetical protein [Streptomyces luteolus]|uniref:Uncharacterized protein n=1 Tax=Streptomyces luteolus TaxID=3043615 RepID=A0ABT6SPH6_9ACTN|nr:hypothetical protein [Streptomyces sp. B-S-A12]MDI3417301.1 hypothetical protein [Streptomyces sp. B-S-A12]